MKSVLCKADGSKGGFVSITLAPANRSAQARFGLVDMIIVLAFLLCTAGLLRFVLAH